MKSAIVALLLGSSNIYLLMSMINHLSYHINPNPLAPYDPLSPYTFQIAYNLLIIPVFIFIVAIAVSAILYALSFCNTADKRRANNAGLEKDLRAYDPVRSVSKGFTTTAAALGRAAVMVDRTGNSIQNGCTVSGS